MLSDLEFSHDTNQEILLKFIYFIYFERVKRLDGINIDHKMQYSTFNFKSVEEFNSRNKIVLDEFEKEAF